MHTEILHMTTLQGTVSDFQTVSHVSGGSNDTSARTTYISTFRLDGTHIRNHGSIPLPIANGESLKIVGKPDNGVFIAHAIKNLSTGFTSSPNPGIHGALIGCQAAMLCAFALVALFVAIIIFNIFSKIAALIPLIMVGLIIYFVTKTFSNASKAKNLSITAHQILQQNHPPQTPQSPPPPPTT